MHEKHTHIDTLSMVLNCRINIMLKITMPSTSNSRPSELHGERPAEGDDVITVVALDFLSESPNFPFFETHFQASS